ncbi:MAG: O-antigen ligase family protein [Erythrobacter sp.]
MAEAAEIRADFGRPMARSSANWGAYGAVALVYILMAPVPFNLSAGPLLLPPYRIFLILSVLFIGADLLKGRLKFCAVDLLIALFAAWIAASSIWNMGAERALEASGAVILDILITYFFMRTAIRNVHDFRVFLIFIAPGVAILGLLLAIESISQTNIAIPIASAITGQPYPTEQTFRLGLMRARGPFPHPILAGVFLGSFLPLFALSGLRQWPYILGIGGALCCVFTLSSGALLVLAASTVLVITNWLLERTNLLNWRIVLCGLAVIIVFLEVASDSGTVGLIARFAAFNQQTAFFRILIWEEGIKTVQAFPFFGIGYNDWIRPAWMPPSVDNYWLLLAMRFGALTPILVLLASAIVITSLAKKSSVSQILDQRILRAVAVALAVVCLGAFSVAVWLSMQVWLFALIAIAVSLAQHSVVQAPVGFGMRAHRPNSRTPMTNAESQKSA